MVSANGSIASPVGSPRPSFPRAFSGRVASLDSCLTRCGPVQRVEQQFECCVRLCAELRAEAQQDDSPLAIAYFDGTELVFDVLGAADPPALERIIGGIAYHRAAAVFRKRSQELERRAIQEIGRRFFRHSVGQWIVLVYQNPDDGPGAIEFVQRYATKSVADGQSPRV